MPEVSANQRRRINDFLDATRVVTDVGELFSDAGFEIYLVGGCVRDILMGRTSHDLDFTTNAHPDETETLLRRLMPAVWDLGRAYGTIGARIDTPCENPLNNEGCAGTSADESAPPPNSKEALTNGKEAHSLDDAEPIDADGKRSWVIEVTTFRADAYREDSRKPAVAFGTSIDDDLKRRDFTVNSLALRLPQGDIVDPFDGLEDLADHILRTPAPAYQSFSDDPLRMMRAARFASQLEFIVDNEARQAMTEMASRISIVSAERVRDEFSKILLSDDPAPGLELMVATGLADEVIPELPALRLERDEHASHKDVYEHSLTVLMQAIELEKSRDCLNGRLNADHEPDIIVRLAALLHDIGKPATRRFEGSKVTFHHHDAVGAKLARARLTALRYPTDVIKAVSHLIALHMRFHGYKDGEWTDSAVRRYVRDAGDQLERLHILTRSDCTTRNARKAAHLKHAYDELEARIDELSAQEQLDAVRPVLDGNEIMAILGIGPGKAVGQAYQFLLSRRLDLGPESPEEATVALKDWWKGMVQ